MLRALLLAGPACLLIIATVPSAASAAGKNCSDFPNRAAAHDWLNAHPGDPDGLDGDHDGQACETLPCPCPGSAVPAPVAPSLPPPPPPPATAPKVLRAQARVTSVTDGDTLKVRFAGGLRATVRLIGIDSPETKRPGTPVQCGGRDATARMKKLALRNGKGRTVHIKTDPTQDVADRYGRLLAYVSASGNDFGQIMVGSGWATTYVYGGVKFQRVAGYRRAQRAAKAARRGVYRTCASDFHRTAATGVTPPRT